MATETSTASKPTRSSRRLIARGLLATVALAGGLFVFWLTSLRGLPDIEIPIDSANDLINIRDKENAFTYYVKANKQLLEAVAQKGLTLESSMTPAQRNSLVEDSGALATWFEGTQCERASPSWNERTDPRPAWPVIRTLRLFSNAALGKAAIYKNEGKYEEAWKWYRASLRSSRHARHIGGVKQFYDGASIYWITSMNAITWSSDPKVGVPLLKQALSDVLELDGSKASIGDTLRRESLEYVHFLDDAYERQRLYSLVESRVNPNPTRFQRFRQEASIVLNPLWREPERSKRVVRLILANWLTVADLPTAERAKRMKTIGKLSLFTPDPGQIPPISPERLFSWFDSTVYARSFLYEWREIESALALEEKSRASLIMHLAEQIYLREHGKLPASPDDLVGPYLKELPSGYDSTGK